MMYRTISFDLSERIATITLNRPEVRNAFGAGMGDELSDAFKECDANDDIRIFAREAKYGIVQSRRGMLGDAMSHWTLPRIVGFANAADILLTGRMFGGDDALRMGLCNEVHDNDAVLSRAIDIAGDIAVNVSPASAAASKRALWSSWNSTSDEMNALETDLHLRLMKLEDAREGVRAFVEKRPPKWTSTADSIDG
jgi:enoyl-CoA hydratase/carnithine racemase